MYSSERTVGTVMSSLGNRIKLVRKLNNLTQKELANSSRVSLSSLKRFENSGQVSLEHLLRIAAVLGRLDDFEDMFKIDEGLINVAKKFDV